MQLHTAFDVEAIFRMRRKKLYDPKYRKQIGLPAVKMGKRLLFRDEDIQALVERGLEVFEGKAKNSNP